MKKAEVVLNHLELSERLEALKAKGRKIVLSDGCFDLLRTGHARYLRAAKALGDVLVLALPSDEAVQKALGPGRPLLPLEDRLGILAAFEMVDWVTSYSKKVLRNSWRTSNPMFMPYRARRRCPRVPSAERLSN